MVPTTHFGNPDDVESINAEMATAGVDYTFKSYQGAQHSFTNPEVNVNGQKFELRLVYDQAADQQLWQDMPVFFDRIFTEEM